MQNFINVNIRENARKTSLMNTDCNIIVTGVENTNNFYYNCHWSLIQIIKDIIINLFVKSYLQDNSWKNNNYRITSTTNLHYQ